MISHINKKGRRGQTALIMILLTAAALIFLAITLNWGRIAQTKSLLTIAADQAASLLASDAASYGEMEKQTYLNDSNQISSLNGMIMALIAVVVAIICLIITITTAGAGSGVWVTLAIVLAVASVVMAVVNLALQICVVQPGITSMWNKLQKEQTIQQQFIEGGISTALQGSVTDQVIVTDYFDLNTNGVLGATGTASKDTISRFAFYYTDRLRMLNRPIIPQVKFFYDQLGEFINGETCSQNENDFANYHQSVSINPFCLALGGPTCVSSPDATCEAYCIADATETDPDCQMPIPNGFQLNDSCTDSDPTAATYNPYCDPCCQPLSIPNPYYNKTPKPALNPLQPLYNLIRPTSCASPPSTATCTQGSGSFNPSDPSCVPGLSGECLTNNPYGASYPYIYDKSFQEYSNGISFLDQYGRDQALIPPPPGNTPPNIMTPQGNFTSGVFFPNGLFPYFWLMKDYSPEVDNITDTPFASTPSLHWCAAATPANNLISIPSFSGPAGFPDLAQLNLTNSSGYYCQGQDCCVYYLANGLSNVGNSATSNSITIGTVPPTVIITSPIGGTDLTAGNPLTVDATVTTANPAATIASVIFYANGTKLGRAQALPVQSGNTWSQTVTIPVCTDNCAATPPTSSPTSGSFDLTATAVDSFGNTATSSPVTITITVPTPAPTCQPSTCS